MAEETEVKRRIRELKNFQGLPSELDPLYRELLVTFKAHRLAHPDDPNTEKYSMCVTL